MDSLELLSIQTFLSNINRGYIKDVKKAWEEFKVVKNNVKSEALKKIVKELGFGLFGVDDKGDGDDKGNGDNDHNRDHYSTDDHEDDDDDENYYSTDDYGDDDHKDHYSTDDDDDDKNYKTVFSDLSTIENNNIGKTYKTKEGDTITFNGFKNIIFNYEHGLKSYDDIDDGKDNIIDSDKVGKDVSRGYNLIKKIIDEDKFKVCSKCIITNINKG